MDEREVLLEQLADSLDIPDEVRSMAGGVPWPVEFVQEPDAELMLRDRQVVTAKLHELRQLRMQIAEYDEAHAAELDRLARRRQTVLGPQLERAAAIEKTLRQFGQLVYRTEGRTRVELPAGSVTSTSAIEKLTVDDDKIAKWVIETAAEHGLFEGENDQEPVHYTAKVYMKPLRDLIVAAGLRRRIRKNDGLHPPEFEVWSPDWEGVFVDGNGEVVAYLSWAPGGDDYTGRNWRITT